MVTPSPPHLEALVGVRRKTRLAGLCARLRNAFGAASKCSCSASISACFASFRTPNKPPQRRPIIGSPWAEGSTRWQEVQEGRWRRSRRRRRRHARLPRGLSNVAAPRLISSNNCLLIFTSRTHHGCILRSPFAHL